MGYNSGSQPLLILDPLNIRCISVWEFMYNLYKISAILSYDKGIRQKYPMIGAANIPKKEAMKQNMNIPI